MPTNRKVVIILQKNYHYSQENLLSSFEKLLASSEKLQWTNQKDITRKLKSNCPNRNTPLFSLPNPTQLDLHHPATFRWQANADVFLSPARLNLAMPMDHPSDSTHSLSQLIIRTPFGFGNKLEVIISLKLRKIQYYNLTI